MRSNIFLLVSIVSFVGAQGPQPTVRLDEIPKQRASESDRTSKVRKHRRLQGTCGGGKVGNGLCADSSMCCSKWGWCGVTSDYCNKKSSFDAAAIATVVTPAKPKPHGTTAKPQPLPVKAKPLASHGTCGGGSVGNRVCANASQCCSKWGWCGITSDYCGKTPPVVAATTLPETTITIPATPPTPHPKSNTSPKQQLTKQPAPTKVSNSSSKGTCGAGRVGNGVCANTTQCCSKWGWCGIGSVHCGGNKATATISTPVIPAMTPKQPPKPAPTIKKPSSPSKGTCGGGSVGNGVCAATAQCCSKWGWCGTTSEFCGSKAAVVTPTSPLPKIPAPTPLVETSPALPPAPNAILECGKFPDAMTVNFGYYQSWARYRSQGCNRVNPQDINVAENHYTHLTYAFAGIDTNDHLTPWGGDYVDEVPQYVAFNALKKTNPRLKTLISVGGWTFTDPGPTQTLFSDISASSTRRAAFAASVITFLQTYGFDGIDVDWEYPGEASRGGQPMDVQNFPLLLKAIRDASVKAGKQIVITMAITTDIDTLHAGYNLAALSKQVDFFNLMAYDINGDWDVPAVIGANADLTYIKTSVQHMLQNGVAANQMVLGLAAYGHTFQLASPSCSKPGCGFTTGGPGGCAGATGDMPYFTIDEYVQSKNYKSLQFNPTTSSMEMIIDGNIWISFDNPYTFNIKASYAASLCLRGVMWWSVDQLVAPIELHTTPQHRKLRKRHPNSS